MNDKTKKKTLTISNKFKKSFEPNMSRKNEGKSFQINKKKFTRNNNQNSGNDINRKKKINFNKPNFTRKFIEQQATKAFIKKDPKKDLKKEVKKDNKNKLKLKAPINKRDIKLTVSRALNVEEIEIKQRSLASVKRARLKEKRNSPEGEEKKEYKKIVRDVNIPDQISIQELSNRMAEKSSDIIKFLFNMKVMATINHVIDKDTAEYIVKEFKHNPIIDKSNNLLQNKKKSDLIGEIKKRPPIVTIMGHVDHGKTSLLDALRASNVVSGEYGGITQHIGAYQVKTDNNETITFIDTPGHAAFTEMRARGSKITDIVVLVVAADDGVKPQTIEAIKHAKAAKVPIIVAINKCDLPNKNISKIKNELMKYELIAEDLSGDTLFVEVSATKKTNLDKLKETILLQSEILDLKASYTGPARAVAIESKIDKGKGPVSTILITNGKLNRGDFFVCGNTSGKIRAMLDFKGKILEFAEPSTPVEVLGMNGVAYAGAEFFVTDSEGEAKAAVLEDKSKSNKNQNILLKDKTNLFENKVDKKELNIIIKSDVQGSSEALKMSIEKIIHDEVKPNIIVSDIGMITETDVTLAKASKAILLGFNVKPNKEAKIKAETEQIEIKFFNIIYEAIEYIEKNLSGLLDPDLKEEILGSAEIKKVFKVSDVGKIAGSKVISGEIKNKSLARIIRDGVVVYNGEISSLFREKNAVKEVKNGLECGISLKDFIDFKERDIIEAYMSKKIERSL